jgi:hypothetical protein
MDDKFQERQNVGNSDHDRNETMAKVADCCIDASIENKREPNGSCCAQPRRWYLSLHAYLLGIIAAIAVVGLYLTMNTLTSDWYFARVQFSENRWWIIGLAFGVGIQMTLYILFRAHLRGNKKTAATSSMAASGGVSAVAMMACCSHYLATVIPLLGIPFISATAVAGLAQYQSYFFLAGVVSCLFGIGVMLHMMRKHGIFRIGVPHVRMHTRSGHFSNV